MLLTYIGVRSLPCKAKRQHQLTLQVSRYCPLALRSSIAVPTVTLYKLEHSMSPPASGSQGAGCCPCRWHRRQAGEVENSTKRALRVALVSRRARQGRIQLSRAARRVLVWLFGHKSCHWMSWLIREGEACKSLPRMYARFLLPDSVTMLVGSGHATCVSPCKGKQS